MNPFGLQIKKILPPADRVFVDRKTLDLEAAVLLSQLDLASLEGGKSGRDESNIDRESAVAQDFKILISDVLRMVREGGDDEDIEEETSAY